MKGWSAVLYQLIWITTIEWWHILRSDRRQWFFEWIMHWRWHVNQLILASRTDWRTGSLRWGWIRSVITKPTAFQYNLSAMQAKPLSHRHTLTFHLLDCCCIPVGRPLHTNALRLRPSPVLCLVVNNRHSPCFLTAMHRCKMIFSVVNSLWRPMSWRNSIDNCRCNDSHYCLPMDRRVVTGSLVTMATSNSLAMSDHCHLHSPRSVSCRWTWALWQLRRSISTLMAWCIGAMAHATMTIHCYYLYCCCCYYCYCS